MKQVAILIPTFNQPQALAVTLQSIVKWTKSAYRIYVIDNSEDGYAKDVAMSIHDDIKVFKMDSNLGWMGGINYGLVHTDEDYVMFLNDDIKILDFDDLWLQKMLEGFAKVPDVGVVVPSSNAVMGFQNFLNVPPALFNLTSAVSGMCLLTSREVVKKVGMLDSDLPGGDDLDFSIRVRDAGYLLAIRKDVFIYHFCSLTGQSLYGKHWNSPEYHENANIALIKKHGLTKFLIACSFSLPESEDVNKELHKGVEGNWEYNTMAKHCVGEGLDIGCGNNKMEGSIGVDITPPNERGVGGSQLGRKSQADITVADTILPFETDSMDFIHAKHVLEHIVDPIEALVEWVRVLKPGGKLIVAIPDENEVDGMPLDPTHKHTYTLESYKNLLSAVTDYTVVEERLDDISFVMVAEISK